MRAGFQRFGAVFLLLVLVTSGWINSGTDRVHGGEPVRIALVLALTGIAAEDNRPAIRAAQLAVSEVNEAGGIHGVPLEMIVMDNGSTPLGSKRVAEEADKAGVLGVIGPLWSSHAMPMASVLQEAGVPMITPTATKPEITGVGDCIFRACMSDRFQGRVMARFAYEHLGARTAVTLTNVSEDYSITLAEVFVRSFEEAGGEILWKGKAFSRPLPPRGPFRAPPAPLPLTPRETLEARRPSSSGSGRIGVCSFGPSPPEALPSSAGIRVTFRSRAGRMPGPG